jgi:hypothetical protein
MPRKRIEIPVAVQQIIATLDAPGCNHGIDGFTHGYAEGAQHPEIPRRPDGDVPATQVNDRQ